jgi:GTP-binding protein
MVKINQTHQSQKVEGRTPKIKYVHQSAVLPPTFIFYGNHLKNVPNSYERYLKNTFINELKLANTTIKIQYKNTDNPFKDKKNKLNAKQISKRKRLVKFTKKNRN